MYRIIAITVLAASTVGCTHNQLHRSTLRQVRTVSDLQQQQVLDNIAVFCTNPHALPHFAVAGSGVANVRDAVSGGATFNYTRVMFDRWLFNFGGGRDVSANWTLAPMNDPDRLKLMQCVYRRAIGYEPPPEVDIDQCSLYLLQYFGPHVFVADVPQGWFHLGSKKDVPKDACFVSEHGAIYVWVTADGLDGLTRVTLSILDIATKEEVPPPPYRYMDAPDVPAPVHMEPRRRKDYFDPLRGLFFVPQ